MIRTVLVLLLALLSTRASYAEFTMEWSGSRRWAGPQAWANPLYDWSVEQGVLVAAAAANRTLHQTVHRVERAEDGFQLSTRLQIAANNDQAVSNRVWAGFAVGLQGLMDDPRHVLVGAKKRINAGMLGDGTIFVDGEKSAEKLAVGKPVDLALTAADGQLTLRATQGRRAVSVTKSVSSRRLQGNIALATDAPQQGKRSSSALEVRFFYWKGSGRGLSARPELSFGPILWSQYTRQGNQVKLLAQMAPVGPEDDQQVTLEIRDGDQWKNLDQAAIESLSRTALFRAEIPAGQVDYRVRYRWLGKDYFWQGTFAPDPATIGQPLRIGVFSCDHGYAFPLSTMVRNIAVQNPNLLFFAGDQIYEVYGGFGVMRKPLEKAMLDYLRKYYQFGWTWRELLKDRPSIIIPDDHDVFQGNLWGAGGRAIKVIEKGGYSMPAEWVNAIQRTQTAHLPDPVDPTPVEQGITVYYTKMNWGDVPIAIIEDRKWKTGFRLVLPDNTRQSLTADELDVSGAALLGERQEKFLKQWSEDTADEPVRFILSQTIFCKGHTHSGPKLNKNRYDFDSNGWPQSGRRRALQPFQDRRTVMLHGDQHLGLLVRQGLDEFDDGPLAFMVPGTSNGWPRAWWPETGDVTGPFTDSFGNRFTVLAAANPEQGANQLQPRNNDPPAETAHRKGSGHGIVQVAADKGSVTFEMWRYLFDASSPRPQDQFSGFPVTVEMK